MTYYLNGLKARSFPANSVRTECDRGSIRDRASSGGFLQLRAIMRSVLAASWWLHPWLASCALGPRIPAPDTRLPAAFEAPTEATADGGDLDHWWRAYDDPQLSSLVEQALRSAPDARSAAARLDEARAVRSSALTAFDPQGGMQGSTTLTNT